MTKLRFAQFSGEIPKLISRLLPDTGSQHAENVRLDDGALTPIRKARPEFSFSGSNIQTIYKFGSQWLSWDVPVNAVPGPVATDRLYYTGDGTPKMRVGATVYDLALPFPATALTAAVTGVGTGDTITRLYVYTWVTSFGEESEPCPVSGDVTWQAGQTITLSGFETTPTGRAITKQRIYRAQTSVSSGTDLFFIEERDATTANYVDSHLPYDFAEVLPSRDWNQPPANLTGLISMPNGMMVGFAGKEICFCEPYQPHAWPEKYRLTVSYDIVALAAYGRTVVAGTTGYPFVVTGNSPDSMIEEKTEVNLPCINGRGMVDLGYSAAYPSNDGLVLVDGGGSAVATVNLFTRADWQRISPQTIVAGQFAGRYFASYSYLDIDDKTRLEGTLIIDLTGQQPFVMRAAFKASAFFYDLASGALYFLVGNTVYEYDALGQTNEIMTWKSKRVVLPQPVSIGAILIEGTTAVTPEQRQARLNEIAAIEAANEVYMAAGTMGSEINGAEVNLFDINGDPLQRINPENFYTSVKVYADGVLIRTISTLNKVVRIPSHHRAKTWEIQVNGTAEVEQITLATTVRELTEG